MLSTLRKVSRRFHLWVSLSIFIPVVIVIGSGLLLQVKKEIDWVQPPTQKVAQTKPVISFDSILTVVKQVPKADVNGWDDIDRLDVRPNKGIIKVRAKNHWEVQLNASNGDILQVAYRRTDTIEAIHDGSWFFEGAKLWLFLPAAILLLVLWLTGIVMLFTTLKSKYQKHHFRSQRDSQTKL